MKTRNPEATCGNCPYWARNPYNEKIGECRIDPRGRCTGGDYPDVYTHGWCGEHPDFWTEQTTDLSAADANINQALNEGDGSYRP